MTISAIDVSIIIPTLNEADSIGSFLEHLLNSHGNFEIIVTDGGSSDGTLTIVSRFANVTLVTGTRGRGRQMNEGAKAARGDFLLFLHADTVPPPCFLQEIRNIMSDPSVAGGCFHLRFDHNNLFLKMYSLFSRINHILFTYGDQGLFVRSHVFRSIGGFQEIPIMEDVEIQKRLRNHGRFAKIAVPVLTSARRYIKSGIIKQQVLNTVLVLLYHAGISPVHLERFYHSNTSRTV